MAVKKLNDYRTKRILALTDDLATKLQKSHLAYTDTATQAFTDFINDPTDAEAFAKLIARVSECRHQYRSPVDD